MMNLIAKLLNLVVKTNTVIMKLNMNSIKQEIAAELCYLY